MAQHPTIRVDLVGIEAVIEKFEEICKVLERERDAAIAIIRTAQDQAVSDIRRARMSVSKTETV